MKNDVSDGFFFFLDILEILFENNKKMLSYLDTILRLMTIFLPVSSFSKRLVTD